MLPLLIQDKISDSYEPGQMLTGKTNEDFVNATTEAMMAVRKIENR